MKIALFTSVYFNNIGNGFIDLGAEATIKSSMSKEDELIKISQCANFAASMGKNFLLKENLVVNWVWTHVMQKFAKKLHDRSYQTISTLDVFSPASMFEFDCMIIPGCVLTVPFFTIYGKLLEKKVEQGCKLIFLGASGNFYTDYEISFVKKYLMKLKPYAIMTRDSIAYENYKDCCSRIYNGIDNVFFVNKLNIPEMKTQFNEYVVINLEEPKHEKLRKDLVEKLEAEGKNIIYTNHKPFPYNKIGKMVKQGKTIISDYPLDYLAIYRNVDTVYSDRVHACIPTLSFGNKAVLFSESPRKALFENVGIKTTKNRPMRLSGLENKQNEQIDYLRNVLESIN